MIVAAMPAATAAHADGARQSDQEPVADLDEAEQADELGHGHDADRRPRG